MNDSMCVSISSIVKDDKIEEDQEEEVAQCKDGESEDEVDVSLDQRLM